MESLKALSILTTFDTLEQDERRKVAIDLVLRAWGLNHMTKDLLRHNPLHPLAHMTWLRNVFGDIPLSDWKRATAAYMQLGIKSARVHHEYLNHSADVIFYSRDLAPRYVYETGSRPPTIYDSIERLIRQAVNIDRWWFESDNGRVCLKDEIMRIMQAHKMQSEADT
jgi:hypothetical protein